MKRRNFVTSMLVVPAATAVAEQTTPPPPAEKAPPAPTPNARPPYPSPAAKLTLAGVDGSAETTCQFFTQPQFSALQRLAAVMMPPLKGNPGALDARAPEFLDFLISESEPDRQKLYRNGLDGLNGAAKKHFHKPFSEVTDSEAGEILKPLLVARTWEHEFPEEPMKHFIARAHIDIRTATINSREWAASGGASNRRGRFNSGKRMAWKTIDPRVGGL